jgi:hypothetical protein
MKPLLSWLESKHGYTLNQLWCIIFMSTISAQCLHSPFIPMPRTHTPIIIIYVTISFGTSPATKNLPAATGYDAKPGHSPCLLGHEQWPASIRHGLP